MINIDNQVISVVIDWVERRIRTSQRAGRLLSNLIAKLDWDLWVSLIRKIVWAEAQRIEEAWKRLYSKNTFKNFLVFVILEKNIESIKNRPKFEDRFHTLSKIYNFESDYLSGLEKYKSDKKIWFTTKRNLFISLFFKKNEL